MKRVVFKVLFFYFLFLNINMPSLAQTREIDSLKQLIDSNKEDTIKVNNLLLISTAFRKIDFEQALFFAKQAEVIAEKIGFRKGIAFSMRNKGMAYLNQGMYSEALIQFQDCLEIFTVLGFKPHISNTLSNMGVVYYNMGEDTKAIDYYFQSLHIAKETNDQLRIGTTYNNIAGVYNNMGEQDKALEYFLQAYLIFKKIKYSEGISVAAMNIGEIYENKSISDSALYYIQESLKLSKGTVDATFALKLMGDIYSKKGDFKNALASANEAIRIADRFDAKFELAQSILGLASIELRQGKIDLAILDYIKAQKIAESLDAKSEMKTAYEALATSYAKLEDFKNAYEYILLLNKVKDSLYSKSNDKKIQQLQFNFDITQKESEIKLLTKDKELKTAAIQKQKIIGYVYLAGLGMLLIIAFFLYQNIRHKQKNNIMLLHKNDEINLQKEKAEKNLLELRATQKQLIQSEKMASLGELTAGIAHEIQNPLNFVNNFSEVNKELLAEMNAEIIKGNYDEVKAIAKDVTENEEKINNHGKRADAIVKGMLQHSRSSNGVKEPTNINALCDEYLRLSYHGLRAKDKNFNATLKTEFDESIGNINIIPQDIGRVILNLINNAFYAAPVPPEGGFKNPQIKHEPTVWVSTKKVGEKVLVSVKDNGPGIPKKILDKIFQPFFTTKPTGQGTGLGLSLSYDIVKAHGGELKVETKVGEGSEFIIQLPV